MTLREMEKKKKREDTSDYDSLYKERSVRPFKEIRLGRTKPLFASWTLPKKENDEEDIDISESPIDSLWRNYFDKGIEIKQGKKIKKYLTKHPKLYTVLRVALQKAICVVDDTNKISIDIFEDQEDNSETVLIGIECEAYNEEVEEDIKDIKSAYLPELRYCSGWISVFPLLPRN